MDSETDQNVGGKNGMLWEASCVGCLKNGSDSTFVLEELYLIQYRFGPFWEILVGTSWRGLKLSRRY